MAKRQSKAVNTELQDVIDDVTQIQGTVKSSNPELVLMRLAKDTLRRAQELVPVVTGTLKETGKVVLPMQKNAMIDGMLYDYAITVEFGGEVLIGFRGVDYSNIVQEGYQTHDVTGKPKMMWPAERTTQPWPGKAAGLPLTGKPIIVATKVSRGAEPKPYLDLAFQDALAAMDYAAAEIADRIVTEFVRGNTGLQRFRASKASR